MLKQKPNQLVLPMPVILIIVLAFLTLWLGRPVSNLICSTLLENTTAIVFDYTRDRDQYWYPAIRVAQPFDYIRDRRQYETTYTAELFDYTRDRDQHWQPTIAVEPFDYTRDRDQYWQLN